jgi:ABC-2 type transport system permease protein
MFLATINKDLRLLLRDRGAMMSLFLLPIVFIAVFGTIFGGDGKPDPIRVATWAGDARGDAIVDALAHTGVFRIDRKDSEEAARAAAAHGDVVAILVPADPGAAHPVEILLDPDAGPTVRGPIEGTTRAVVNQILFGSVDAVVFHAPPGVREPLADASGFQITVPGNAVLFGFFLSLTVGLSFVEERKRGTWRRILAAPVDRRLVLVAKLVPFFLVGLIQFTFLFGIGAIVFGMRIAGSTVALVALTASIVLCATSLGLAMAAIGGSEKQLGGVGSICLLVMGLLGGSMVPRFVMPPAMRTAGLFVPHGWALDGYYDVLVRPGTGLADVAPQIAAILGFAAVFATFGVIVFKYET